MRIMTYNVHRCVGVDRKLDVGRVAAVIAEAAPDVVALQEVDVGRQRTRGVDQAHEIARRLGMDFHFHAALRVEEEEYGDAILTPHPLRVLKSGALPGLAQAPALEPRGALWVAVEIGGREVQVMNTHLGLVIPEQLAQVDALLGREWMARRDCRDPFVLVGDFNATMYASPYRRLAAKLSDAQIALGRRPLPTYPSVFPMLRIDHVFLSQSVRIVDVKTPNTGPARLASDHLPLVADLEISAGA